MNALRAFEASGRHLSFAAAAAELGVTQSAVAQQVRRLEERLGLRLFERRPRGLGLTDSGRAYHQGVAGAFAQLHEATALLRPEASRVTISVTATFASNWLIPRLEEVTEAHPDIDLRILATDSVLSFRADGIDLAVRQGSPPFGAGLEDALLFRQEVVAVCAPRLLPAGAARLTLADLRQLALLHDSHNLWPRYLAAAFGDGEAESGEAALPRGMRFNQTALSLDAARSGQGVALASRFLVKRDLEAGRLVQALDAVVEGGQDFHLLTPRQPPPTAAVRAIRSWLLDASASGG